MLFYPLQFANLLQCYFLRAALDYCSAADERLWYASCRYYEHSLHVHRPIIIAYCWLDGWALNRYNFPIKYYMTAGQNGTAIMHSLRAAVFSMPFWWQQFYRAGNSRWRLRCHCVVFNGRSTPRSSLISRNCCHQIPLNANCSCLHSALDWRPQKSNRRHSDILWAVKWRYSWHCQIFTVSLINVF